MEKTGPSVEDVVSLLKEYEFSTFQLGTTCLHEKDIFIRAITERFGATFAEKHPDLTIVLGPGTMEVVTRPLFVYGRYLKTSREIPQTRWPCRVCKGVGCPRCGGTGKMYQESVEEILGAPLLAATGGTGTRLHGCGREDIDARMLGSGRPFVIEVINPRCRKIDLPEITHEKANYLFLRFCEKGVSRMLKSCAAFKRYRAQVTLENEVDDLHLKKAHDLCGVQIDQQTPTRVLHRRKDLKRGRAIVGIVCRRCGPTELELELVVASGFYVKEFVSGDRGRSTPSLAEILDVGCTCTRLDVLAVFDPTLFDLIRETGESGSDPHEGAQKLGMTLSCGCNPKTQLERMFTSDELPTILDALSCAATADASLALTRPDDDF
ncbi:MAG: tRNA pseudouridine(54/55) synthase Pus10 [Methanopyri archaeon]|jgi:tRNA pseudouridine synthase 10|nr:tRNA pseudouridine(54/55) synthase Pus10 [Methanopyri archaeon]